MNSDGWRQNNGILFNLEDELERVTVSVAMSVGSRLEAVSSAPYGKKFVTSKGCLADDAQNHS